MGHDRDTENPPDDRDPDCVRLTVCGLRSSRRDGSVRMVLFARVVHAARKKQTRLKGTIIGHLRAGSSVTRLGSRWRALQRSRARAILMKQFQQKDKGNGSASVSTVSSVFLRFALGFSLLSAVADRFGMWGTFGKPAVAWGNFAVLIVKPDMD